MNGRRWLIVAGLLLWASPVRAQGWGDFFESLSGPGPFKGFGAYWRVACVEETTFRGSDWNIDGWCMNDVKDTIRQVLEVRGLMAWSLKDRPVLIADPSDTRGVTLYKLTGIASLRVSPFLDMGAGGGYIGFKVENGPRVHRPLIVPFTLTYTPMGGYGGTVGSKTDAFKRLLRILLEVNYIPYGFTGRDWGKPNITTSQYATDGNWVLAGGVLIDAGSFLPDGW